MAVTPLGFIAVLAGWTVTETGRQPWIIYGALRTADAVAPVTAAAVTTSLLIFFLLYNVLLLAFVWFAGRVALRGPTDPAKPVLEHPGLERANSEAILSDAPQGAAPAGA